MLVVGWSGISGTTSDVHVYSLMAVVDVIKICLCIADGCLEKSIQMCLAGEAAPGEESLLSPANENRYYIRAHKDVNQTITLCFVVRFANPIRCPRQSFAEEKCKNCTRY